MEIKLKRMPFDIELAKKITEGKIKGAKIMTKQERNARIISFDKEGEYNIVALVQNSKTKSEDVIAYNQSGLYYKGLGSYLDLCLYVPISYNDYSNFVPQKWQPCLVRESIIGHWLSRVATGENSVINRKPLFYEDARERKDYARTFSFMLPISKKTIQLLGTTKSYEQLLEEQWTNEE